MVTHDPKCGCKIRRCLKTNIRKTRWRKEHGISSSLSSSFLRHSFVAEKRRHKEITDTYTMKFPDYTFLDLRLQFDETVFRGRSSFCVEIKPKQGYLQQAEQRISRCPYCLIQYAKVSINYSSIPREFKSTRHQYQDKDIKIYWEEKHKKNKKYLLDVY